MGFDLGFPVIDEKNGEHSAKIYFKTNIVVRESNAGFHFYDLFAAIGGFVGIFVGLSLMDTITAFKRSLQVIPPQIRKITKSGPPPPSAP